MSVETIIMHEEMVRGMIGDVGTRRQCGGRPKSVLEDGAEIT